ncbi:MAG: ComF family protein [Firmicutes bacterium]|nr:ComF family protein [Bacillota bacterium]
MDLLQPLFDLLFPPRCRICRSFLRGEKEKFLCTRCAELILNPADCCRYCGYPLDKEKKFCDFCVRQNFAFAGVCAVSRYHGPFKKAIQRFKYTGHLELASVFGKLLAQQVRQRNWPQVEVLVPIPLHPKKLWQRGYDQSQLLAEAMAQELKIPGQNLLERKRYTVSQTELSAGERWQNMNNAFTAVEKQAMPSCVLLVDDLLTTGATAHFAALALRRAGVKEVYLAVIARAVK